MSASFSSTKNKQSTILILRRAIFWSMRQWCFPLIFKHIFNVVWTWIITFCSALIFFSEIFHGSPFQIKFLNMHSLKQYKQYSTVAQKRKKIPPAFSLPSNLILEYKCYHLRLIVKRSLWTRRHSFSILSFTASASFPVFSDWPAYFFFFLFLSLFSIFFSLFSILFIFSFLHCIGIFPRFLRLTCILLIPFQQQVRGKQGRKGFSSS